MKCLVCKKSTGYYTEEQVEPGTSIQEPYPLYQRSYSHEDKEYISPRCSKCFDQAVEGEQG